MDVRWRKGLILSSLVVFTVTLRVLSAEGVFYSGHLPFDLFPVVAMISLVAGYSTRSYFAAAVPMASLAVSDAVLYLFGSSTFLGTTSVVVSLFVITGFSGISVLGRGIASRRPSALWFAGGCVWSVLLYDAWTNFGFYLAFSHGGPQALVDCYLAAVPFTLMHILGMAALALPGYLAAMFIAGAVRPSEEVSPVLNT